MADPDQLDLLAELDPHTHARTEDPGTSHAAAAQLSSKRTMMRRLLTQYASVWLTAEEAALACGFTAADGAWKRVSDLLNAGLLEDSGQLRTGSSGRAQRVLRITAAGREALRAPRA